MAKRTHSSVSYSLGGDHCGVCKFFYGEDEATETGHCRLVEDPIGEAMWCKLFERKGGGQSVGMKPRMLGSY